MSQSISRRGFLGTSAGIGLAGGIITMWSERAAGQSAAGVMGNKFQKAPPMAPERVQDWVRVAHFDFDRIKSLHKETPGLINAAWDWGNGAWETALGAASHMGRRDIATYLLENKARMDLFAATMLGRLEIVKAALAAFPEAIRVPGPHGIPLIKHAQVGGKEAVAVLEFLKAFKA